MFVFLDSCLSAAYDIQSADSNKNPENTLERRLND
jgi:hypothetical protein